MVVGIFIDIKRTESVVRLVRLKVNRDFSTTINRNKVGCMVHCVQMYEGDIRLTMRIEGRMNNPHAGVLIRFVSTNEPVDENTRVISSQMNKGEKCENVDNVEPPLTCTKPV